MKNHSKKQKKKPKYTTPVNTEYEMVTMKLNDDQEVVSVTKEEYDLDDFDDDFPSDK